MANKKFIYFIVDENNQSYYLQNGVVAKRSTPTPITYSPSGWREQAVKFARNNTYHGLIPSFTIPLKFVKDGARILRHLLYNNGTEELCFLVVLRFNSLIGEYESYYKGEIDFSKKTNNKDFFEVQVSQTGFYKNLKAYENTEFEVEFTGPDVVDVEMDGILLEKTKKYTFGDGGQGIFLPPNTSDFTLNCLYVTEEGSGFDLIDGDSPYQDLGGWSPSNDSRAILKNIGNQTIDCNISGKLGWYSSNIGVGNVKIYLYKSDGVKIDLVTITAPFLQSIFSFNQNFTLLPNQHVSILCQYPSTSGSLLRVYSIGGNELFSIKYLSRFKTTYIKAIKPLAFGQQLLNKVMANAAYTLQSNVLQSTRIAITTGDQIRGIVGSKAKAKFKDFFTAFHRNLVVGMQVNEATKIVDLPYKSTFYNSSLIYNLGEVRDCSFEIDEGLLYSSIKVGYPNQDYDDVNGRDEPNNTHIYTTPTTRSTKELDLTHAWRADPYGIESTRINLEGKTTTDSKADNNLFFLDIAPKTGNVFNGTITSSSVYNGSGVNLPFSAKGFGFTINTNSNAYTYQKDTKTLTITGSITAFVTPLNDYLFSILVNNTVVYRTQNQSNAPTSFTHSQVFNNGDVISFNLMGLGVATTITVTAANFGIAGIDLYRLNRPSYTSITGVISPGSIFNTELSPKRILLAHQAFIKSTQWGLNAKKIAFQTTEKNANLSTTIGGVTIKENADVLINSLNGEYFYPILAKFKAQVPAALLTILNNNTYGVFEFVYLGNTYNGYLVECSQKPSGNEAQEWTLLLSINNNLNNLIHG